MHCMNCGARIAITAELYCDDRCATAARSCRRPAATLPDQHRSTLRALLEDRPVSREDAAGFYSFLTHRLAA